MRGPALLDLAQQDLALLGEADEEPCLLGLDFGQWQEGTRALFPVRAQRLGPGARGLHPCVRLPRWLRSRGTTLDCVRWVGVHPELGGGKTQQVPPGEATPIDTDAVHEGAVARPGVDHLDDGISIDRESA